MKRAAAITLGLIVLFFAAGCGLPPQPAEEVRYFFSGIVLESDGANLLVEVCSPGNSGLADGSVVEAPILSPKVQALDLSARAHTWVLMTKSEKEGSRWRPAILALR